MPASSTYTPIQVVTLGTAASTIQLNSIPTGYTDLVLVCNLRAASGTPSGWIRLNNASGADYGTIIAYGTGSSVATYNAVSAAQAYFDVGTITTTANAFNSVTFNFNNYADGNTYRNWIWRTNSTTSQIAMGAALWRSNNAIASITIGNDGGVNYAAGSYVSLYGITTA
jgi:hypothetical protein